MQRQTFETLKRIVADVNFPGREFFVRHTGETLTSESRFYLQLEYDAKDSVTGEMRRNHTRKWYLSNEATKSEVVQTCLLAVKTSQEHELREFFTYRGRAIFQPHWSIEKLWQMAGDPANTETREEDVAP
ncbi:MAG TPA: hypothetical protein VMT98_13805 [Verrucomicrobiae bacterium]|jgi:hypothetical protein|nr:hypothetical protein [Verrucomicrobiae bacterium]